MTAPAIVAGDRTARVARPVLIGVGNPWRGDDGVGAAVAMAAAPRLGAEADVVTCDGEPARLLELWAGRPMAGVVDAVVSGAPAGTSHLVEVAGTHALDGLGSDGRAGGSHAIGVADAVRLGRAVDRLPDRLVVVGVEGQLFDHSEAMVLSPPVAAALPELIEQVVAMVTGRATRRRGRGRADHPAGRSANDGRYGLWPVAGGDDGVRPPGWSP